MAVPRVGVAVPEVEDFPVQAGNSLWLQGGIQFVWEVELWEVELNEGRGYCDPLHGRNVLLRGTQRKIRAKKRSPSAPKKQPPKEILVKRLGELSSRRMKTAVMSPESAVYHPRSGASSRKQISSSPTKDRRSLVAKLSTASSSAVKR